MKTTPSVPVSTIEARLADIKRESENLAVERRALESLLRQAVTDEETEAAFAAAMADNPEGKTDGARLKPREAILALLEQEPGLTPTGIAERLESRVDSAAKDKRNVLRTTAAGMVRRGLLERRNGNRHYVIRGSGS